MILGNNSLVEVEKELTEFKKHHLRNGFQLGKEMALIALSNYKQKFGETPQASDKAEWTDGYMEGLRAAIKVVDEGATVSSFNRHFLQL